MKGKGTTGAKTSKRETTSNTAAESELLARDSKVEDLTRKKPKSYQEIVKEISVSHRFLPFDREKLKVEGFALTGAALKRYGLARKFDDALPDLTVETVQKKIVHRVFTELDKSFKLVTDALRSDSSAISNSAESITIPRSTKVHLPPETGKRLGFTYTEKKPEEKILDVKWRKIAPVLAPVNFSAPGNLVLKALEQNLAYANHEPASDAGDDDSAVSDTPKDDTSGNGTPDLAARIDQLLNKLDKGATEEEIYPDELKSKRQTSLYQSVGAEYEQPLNCSAADAVAYYDFYDLKLALDPVWTEVTEFTADHPMPKVIRGFDDAITVDVWNRYCQRLDELGKDSKEVEGWAMHALINDIYQKVLRQEPPISYNGLTFDELMDIWGLHGWDADFERNNYKGWEEAADSDNLNWISAKIAMLSSRQTEFTTLVTDEILTIANEVAEAATIFLGTPSTLGYPGRVFAPGSANYGLLVNYRQEWIPESWQVGELVQTIPLAPKEKRRYTKKMVVSKKRSRKEIDNSLSIRKADDATSTRAESQIVQKAQESTSFDATASGGVEVEIFEIGANASGSTTFKTSASSDSSESKRRMRQAVAKSAREFRSEHKVEVQIDDSTSVEEFEENVLSNPNEEITVTYLFYELQRRFLVSEALHNVRSVILVANEVPPWTEIDWDWIKRYDWILKRCLMDDSFKPALDYVLEGQEAMEIKLEALKARKDDLTKLVEGARKAVEKLAAKSSLAEADLIMIGEALYTTVGKDDGIIEDVFEGIFGGAEGTKIEEYEKRVEGAVDRLDRIEQKIKAKQEDLTMQRNALDRAVAEYTKGVLEKHSKIRQVDRLIEHLRDNILYYMKAIWSHEPPDQRYLRLFDHKVPFWGFPDDDTDIMVRVRSTSRTINDVLPGDGFELILPPPDPGKEEKRKLVEIADIENLLGFKGNYMIFPLRIQSYVTAYMVQDFVGGVFDAVEKEDGDLSSTNIEELLNAGKQPAAIGQAMQTYAVDPDPNASFSAHSLKHAVEYLESHGGYLIPKEIKTKLNDLLEKGLLSPESAPQRIIVPSDSLYIEALPGKHPILEDFKLRHRMIDAQKAIAEHKSMELENIRAEARLRKLDLSDPEVDKIIRIEGADADVSVDT